MTTHISAVILAAGKGTRMKSNTPKVLHRVLGRSMVGHVVEKARGAGCARTVVIVGHGRRAVEATLEAEHGGEDLHFAVQEQQLGTGHAVMQAREALVDTGGHVLVLTGDAPNLSPETLEHFVGLAHRDEPLLCAIITMEVDDPTGYGRILRDGDGAVVGNVEHKDASDEQRRVREVNAGFYLFDAAFLWKTLPELSTENESGELYLPDLIAHAARFSNVAALVAPHQECAGVNDRAQLAFANRTAQTARNRELMRSGVTMIDPASTWVDVSVSVSPDVVLEPQVRLTGKTTVGSGALIRQGAIVENSVVEGNTVIKPYCHIHDAVIREGAQVGPFCHLRPGSDVGPDARVGNFVEVKKSTLGRGVKAGHLAYLGDATIGAECNIGAGTITCNYNGYAKNKTTLGEGVFIGSNSSLVAPVNIDRGAYVGAGSTITGDVPADALGVARGRQRNIEGWAARWRRQHGDKG